jgi:hypothetical protein
MGLGSHHRCWAITACAWWMRSHHAIMMMYCASKVAWTLA